MQLSPFAIGLHPPGLRRFAASPRGGQVVLLAAALLSLTAHAQDPQDLPQSDPTWRRKGIHSGNKVRTVFYNYGLVGNIGEISGEWPIGTGDEYVGDVTPLVAVEFVNERGDTVHSVVTCDGPRGNSDGPGGGVFWGFEPLPDFVDPRQDGVAMSHLPTTWPATWPDKPHNWDGYWNGFFGRGVLNADQESFFYMDDAQDAEFNKAEDGSTLWMPVKDEPDRYGLGLRMKVRGFQWSHFLAEDVIFWLYEVTNISDHDYDKVAFGMVVGTLSGGRQDANDDLALFDLTDDITYSYDCDDIGSPGWECASENLCIGYVGYAFLESPGNPFNGIDDDGDGEEGSPVIHGGMLAGEIPNNGIDDNGNGLVDEGIQHIGLYYADGVDNDNDGFIDEMIDERRDDGIDNDGDWDPLVHDTGADGVPGTGDEGEGDGVPTPGERNFDATDVDESDQIGLTSFEYFAPSTALRMDDDDALWERMQPGHFDVTPNRCEDGDFIYGSGYFPLKSGQTQRFSIALVFGADSLDIFENKRTAQKIYDDNYNFARPPANPKVWAVADSGRVTLYWDGTQSENSFDDVLGYDFEGYKIYRSTEPYFNESFTITDGTGRKIFNEPIAQFDKIDGRYGFFELPIEGRGVQFFLGNETGLRYKYVDTDVTNGQTYFYAVVAYDHGDVEKNIQPAENTKSITEQDDGTFLFDDNTVMVTPGVRAGGYREPTVSDVEHVKGDGTGAIAVEIVDPTRVGDRSFEISFFDSTFWRGDSLHARATVGYTVRELEADSVVVPRSSAVGGTESDDFFGGVRITVDPGAAVDIVNDETRWSGAPAGVFEATARVFNFRRTRGQKWPGVYELRFHGEPVGHSTEFELEDIVGTIPLPAVDTYFTVHEVTGGVEKPVPFAFWEPTGADQRLDPGDHILLLRPDPADSSTFVVTWGLLFEEGGGERPGDGAILHFRTNIPFRGGPDGDVFRFSTNGASAVPQGTAYRLSDIRVVPNPYVAANSLEPRTVGSTGRGERRIYFNHLPPQCTIRIYTVRGELVDTIHHDGGTEFDGTATWDLRSKDNLDVAYGVYFYHVDAPGYGEHLGKLAVIK